MAEPSTNQGPRRVDATEHEAQSSGGIFIRLKSKGDFAKFKLIDHRPLVYPTTITPKDKPAYTRDNYMFIVLDQTEVKSKAEASDPAKLSVKIMELGPQAYNLLHKILKENKENGVEPDYSIKFTRDEKDGAYYSMVALQGTGGKFSEVEEGVIEAFLKEHDITLDKALEHFYYKYIDKSGKNSSDDEPYDPHADV